MEEGKLEPISKKKLWIHYLILPLLVLSMMHKLILLTPRISTATLDTSTFVCTITCLCYLVAFGISCSGLILHDETMDLINGWSDVLTYYAEDEGKPMPLIANTKSAVVVSSLAILAMAIAWTVSGFSIAFRTLPVTLITLADVMGVISAKTKIPRLIWKLLFWPLEFIMYLLPMFLAGWGAMVMMLGVMVVMNCTNQLRYNFVIS